MSAMTRPGRPLITTTRVDRNTASATEWVMNSAANCRSSNIRSSSSLSRSRVISSSAPNGSSNRNTSGSRTSDLASDARIRMPPDSWCGRCFSKPVRPTSSMASVILRPRSALSIFSSSASSPTFCATVRQGSRVASWKT